MMMRIRVKREVVGVVAGFVSERALFLGITGGKIDCRRVIKQLNQDKISSFTSSPHRNLQSPLLAL